MRDTLPQTYSGSAWRSGLIPLGALGILLFLLGGIWDVAWHIDQGRESFWSPPHLVLYSGIWLVLLVPALSLWQAWRLRGSRTMPDAAATLRLPFGLRLNPGLFIAGLGAFMALTSAPIDELFHQLFGLDVSIWSPPHLQLIFGVSIATLGLMAALAGELNRAQPQRVTQALPGSRLDWPHALLLFLAALLMTALGGTLAEYAFDIPDFPILYHPIVMAPIVVGVLMAGARASGQRWSATAIATLHLALSSIFQLELSLLGHSRPVFPLILPAAVLIDLLWQRDQQTFKAVRVVGIAAAATVLLLVGETLWLAWWDQLTWPASIWPVAFPAALASGVVGGLIGARVGAALRSVAVEAARRPAPAFGAAGPTGALLIGLFAFSLMSGIAHAHLGPPSVEIRLSDPEVAVGREVSLEVRIFPPNAVQGASDLILHVERAGVEFEPHLKPTDTPGVYTATITLPDPGRWIVGMLIFSEDDQWLGWFRLDVAEREGEPVRNQEVNPLKLQPNRLRDPDTIPRGLLFFSSILVWIFTVVLLVGVVYALSLIERDALARVRGQR